MVTIKVHFDGKTLVPDEPLGLAAGQQYVVHIEEIAVESSNGEPGSLARFMATHRLADDIDLPNDLGKNLAHYLYGTPKREE